MRKILPATAAACALLLAGCGLKGPLYMGTPPPPRVNKAVSAPAPASAPAPDADVNSGDKPASTDDTSTVDNPPAVPTSRNNDSMLNVK